MYNNKEEVLYMDVGTITQIITAAFTGIYVILTLIIVIITGRSFKATRDALAASDKQSQAAIDAVHKQIAASEQQAQEALYNQHKPVIVPVDTPVSNNAITYTMKIENQGTGVALNTWGVITMKEKPPENIPLQSALPFRYYFVQTYFLIPNVPAQISFRLGEGPFKQHVGFSDNMMFEGYSIYPLQDESSSMYAAMRFMLTYNDAFNNKYLVIFDYNPSFGWRQIDGIKRTTKRLDEVVG
jgi:hypothetical protein